MDFTGQGGAPPPPPGGGAGLVQDLSLDGSGDLVLSGDPTPAPIPFGDQTSDFAVQTLNPGTNLISFPSMSTISDAEVRNATGTEVEATISWSGNVVTVESNVTLTNAIISAEGIL